MDGSGYDSRNYYEAELQLKRAPRQILAHPDIISLTGDRVGIETSRSQEMSRVQAARSTVETRISSSMGGLSQCTGGYGGPGGRRHQRGQNRNAQP